MALDIMQQNVMWKVRGTYNCESEEEWTEETDMFVESPLQVLQHKNNGLLRSVENSLVSD
jgi:hypothetical protein